MTEAYMVTPLSPLRKVIAARMMEAKQTIPHYRVAIDIEVDKLLSQRKQFNVDNPESKISINDFIIKACAMALMEKPEINIQLVEDKIHQYSQADISVIVAVEGGLSTPIVRNANTKSIADIAKEVKNLSTRAAKGQLKMAELLGGSFSISNLGMYDVDQFDAIINPPQCAILAVAGAKHKPAIKDGTITTTMVMRVTLSVDHRAIDGATAASYLSVLQELLQNPEIILK